MASKKYYSLAEIKILLGIDDADEADDILLNQLGVKSDRKVDNDLSFHLSTYPITSDSSITRDIEAASNYNTGRMYKITIKDFEGAKELKELYNEEIDGIKHRLEATSTTRTRRKAVTKAYLTDPLKNNFDEGLL